MDWIDRLSRNFKPIPNTRTSRASKFVENLAVDGAFRRTGSAPHSRPIWSRAYFLRNRLKQSQEAEDFVRDGLKNNPCSQDLLFALGQIYLEDRKDYPHAKNLFLAALRCVA